MIKPLRGPWGPSGTVVGAALRPEGGAARDCRTHQRGRSCPTCGGQPASLSACTPPPNTRLDGDFRGRRWPLPKYVLKRRGCEKHAPSDSCPSEFSPVNQFVDGRPPNPEEFSRLAWGIELAVRTHHDSSTFASDRRFARQSTRGQVVFWIRTQALGRCPGIHGRQGCRPVQTDMPIGRPSEA